MFIGEYRHTLDEKGRLAVPAKFRSALKEGAVITKGLEHCLTIYTREAWEQYAAKVANLPSAQAHTRAFERHMLAGAMDFELDGQGRGVVPEYLRQYAGIKKKAVVAGLYNRLEVWDERAWEKYRKATEKDAAEIAERMSGLGV